MARATIELHDRSEDALSTIEDLRAVGLGEANVAAVFLDAGPLSEPRSGKPRPPETGARSVRTSIPGLGSSIISGWLADALPPASGLDAEAWLRQLLERARPSDKNIKRVIDTLHAGGAIVSVCSDDRIGSQPSVSEVLKGRGP